MAKTKIKLTVAFDVDVESAGMPENEFQAELKDASTQISKYINNYLLDVKINATTIKKITFSSSHK